MRSYKRILIVKADHIGDVLWSTPVIAALKNYFPQAHISVLVLPYTCQILEDNNFCDEIISFPASWKERWRLLRQLRKKRFDLVINLGPIGKFPLLAYITGARERIGYYYSRRPFTWLASNLLLTAKAMHPSDSLLLKNTRNQPVHEVEAMLKLLKFIGIEEFEDTSVIFNLKQEDWDYAKEFYADNFQDKGKVFCVHLCQKWFREGWPVDEFPRLIEMLISSFSCQVMITYGPWEKDLWARIRKSLSKEKVVTAGDLDLRKWAALIGKSHLLISPDTGAVHLAVAMNIPVVDIFPANGFEYCSRRYGPWKGRAVCIKKDNQRLIGQIQEAVEDLLGEEI